jgi:hypothetical protein
MSGFDAASLADLKAHGTVTAANVQALLQAYTDGRQLNAETAQLLISINATARELDTGWAPCFVDILSDFLVLQWDPIGYLTVEKSCWIMGALSQHKTTACAAGAKAEMELLIGLLSLSRWSPQTLVAFALRRQMSKTAHNAPLHNEATTAIDDNDVEMLRRVLYAFGHDDMIAMTRLELDFLREIDAAAAPANVCAAWHTLFQKALFDSVLSVSGHVAASREEMLSPDPVRVDGAPTCDWKKPYRTLSPEERAIVRLERQKVEIVTHEVAPVLDGAWFAALCQTSPLSRHVKAVIARIETIGRDLTPEIVAAINHVNVAA